MVKNAANDFYDKVKYDDNFKLEIASVEEKIRKKVLDEETAQRNLNDIVTKYIKKYKLNLTFNDVIKGVGISELSVDDLENVSGGFGSREICSMLMAGLAITSSVSVVSNYFNSGKSSLDETRVESYQNDDLSSDKSVESIINKINNNVEKNDSDPNGTGGANDLKNNVDDKQKQSEKINLNNAGNQDEINELLKQIKALKQENDSLRDENNQLRENNSEYRDQNQKLREQNNEYEDQNQKLRAQTNDMYELIEQLQTLDSGRSTVIAEQVDGQALNENMIDAEVQTEEQDVPPEEYVQASKENVAEAEVQIGEQDISTEEDVQTSNKDLVETEVQTEEQNVSPEEYAQVSKENMVGAEVQSEEQNSVFAQNTQSSNEKVAEETGQSEVKAEDSNNVVLNQSEQVSKENKDDNSGSTKEDDKSEVQNQEQNKEAPPAHIPPPPPPPAHIPPPPAPPRVNINKKNSISTKPSWANLVRLPAKNVSLGEGESITADRKEYEYGAKAQLVKCNLNIDINSFENIRNYIQTNLLKDEWKTLKKKPSVKNDTKKNTYELEIKKLKNDIGAAQKKIDLCKKARDSQEVKAAIEKYQKALKSVDENTEKFNNANVYNFIEDLKNDKSDISKVYSEKIILEECKKDFENFLQEAEKNEGSTAIFAKLMHKYGLDSVDSVKNVLKSIEKKLKSLEDANSEEFPYISAEIQTCLDKIVTEKKALAEEINNGRKVIKSYADCETLLNLDSAIQNEEKKLLNLEAQMAEINNKIESKKQNESAKSVPISEKVSGEDKDEIVAEETKEVQKKNADELSATAGNVVSGGDKEESKEENSKSEEDARLKAEKEAADCQKVSAAIKMGKEKGVFSLQANENEGNLFNNLLKRLKEHPNIPANVLYLESKYGLYSQKLSWDGLVDEFTNKLTELYSSMSAENWESMGLEEQHELLISTLDALNKEA